MTMSASTSALRYVRGPVRRQQLVVAVERQLDAVGDLQPGLAPSALHRVDDLARETLAPQVVIQRQLQRDRMRALALELVALSGASASSRSPGPGVVVPVDEDADDRPPRSASTTCAGSSAATASVTCGIALPNRGPSVR